jgi:hypothetical protein
MMFGTFAVAAALTLAPAQPGKAAQPATPATAGTMNFTNVRTTYGELGAVRTDNRYLPGDLYFLAFDIEGITVSAEGKVSYTMTFEITDKTGKAIYKPEKPAESDEYFPLGGNRMPARVYVILRRDQEPGTLTCKVSVADRGSPTRAAKDLVRTFEVIPRAFGIIGVVTSYDVEGAMPAPPIGTVGQNMYVHCMLSGFGRGADKAPNAFAELRIFDAANRPTLAKPIPAIVPKDLPPTEDLALVRYLVPFNREGNFTVEVKATDATSGKTAVVSFPIRIGPPAK